MYACTYIDREMRTEWRQESQLCTYVVTGLQARRGIHLDYIATTVEYKLTLKCATSVLLHRIMTEALHSHSVWTVVGEWEQTFVVTMHWLNHLYTYICRARSLCCTLQDLWLWNSLLVSVAKNVVSWKGYRIGFAVTSSTGWQLTGSICKLWYAIFNGKSWTLHLCSF